MDYSIQIAKIKSLLPDVDIVTESEFHLFKNEKFAKKAFEYFIIATQNIKEKLNIELNFAFRYQHNFNATAYRFGNENIILINVGIINELEILIDTSINNYLEDPFTIQSSFPIEKNILTELFIYLISSYIFYHELAHILQFNFSTVNNSFSFSEQYNYTKPFDIKNHIYELDADSFGICIGTILLLQYLENNKIQDQIIVFNLTSLYLFLVSKVFIEFTNKPLEKLYYKEYSHPHPVIRIVECNEQIINTMNLNMSIDKNFFLFTLKRCGDLLDKTIKKNNSSFNYSSTLTNNFENLEKYNTEIEHLNDSYKELTRFRAQEIYNRLGIASEI